MLAQTIIDDAYSEIRVKRLGFDLSGEEVTLGLRKLNRMLSNWSARRVMVAYRTRESLSLASGAYVYTIGSGGTIDTVRPTAIAEAKLSDGSSEYGLSQVSLELFSAENNPSSEGRPRGFYYEPTFPLGTIYFTRALDQAYTLILNSYKPMTSFSDLVTDTDFAPEYEELLVSNLAVRLAPDFGKSASQDTKAIAMQTYNAVKGSNIASRVPTLGFDSALARRARYSIYSDDQ